MNPSSTQYTEPQLDVIARYQYNEAYQQKILGLLVRYPNFIHKYGEVVKPEFFEYEPYVVVCKLALDFYSKYRVVPTYDSLIAWATDYCSRYHIPSKSSTMYLSLIASLFSCDMSDADAVKDTAIEFAKRQSLKRAVREITDIIDKNAGYDKSLNLIQRALLVGQGVGSHGQEVYQSMPGLPVMLSSNSPYAASRKIATPFTSLNQARMGGLGPGECMILVGSSGQGKSIIKNNCGYAASVQAVGDEWVAHATLELSELDNLLRYTARITQTDQEDIISNNPRYLENVQRVVANNSIFVKWFPPGSTNVGHLRSWISALAGERGAPPCALVVDYPDKLVSMKGSSDSLYVDAGRIYDELIALLHDYQMPGYFSSQFTRASQYKEDSDSSNIANSIAKLYHADVVGIIRQTKEQKVNGIGSIWWDKNRRGRDMFTTYFRINYSRAHVYEDDELTNHMMQAQEAQNPSNQPHTPAPGNAGASNMPQYMPAPPPSSLE